MGLFANQISPITGYSGPTAQEGGTVQNFDSLSIPLVSAEQRVEAVQNPGLDFHGLRLGRVRAEPVVARGVLFGTSLADGAAALARLRGFKPQPGAANYYGVLVYWSYDTSNPESQRVGGPYSVLAADYARPHERLLNHVGATVIPGVIRYRFEFVVRLLQRQVG